MKKVGYFYNNILNQKLFVVSHVTPNNGERIEIYKDAKDYDIINTSKSIAAYFRKSQEFVLGYDDLIKDYLKTITLCSTMNGEITQTKEFCTEGFKIVQTKTNNQLSISNSIVLINGLIKEEEYITQNWCISLSNINDETSFIEPINVNDYRPLSIVSDFSNESALDADYYTLDYLKARYNLDHIEDYDYVVVDSIELARERLEKWSNARVKLKAVDIESTGLRVSIFGEDLITGVVLSYDWEPLGEVENSTYFPFRQTKFKYNLPIEFLSEIAEAINNQPKTDDFDSTKFDGVLILAHNGKMEYKSFWQDNLKIRIDVDTYTLSTLVETRMQKGLHTLKNRANQITGLEWLELEQVFKTKDIRFDILPPEIVKYYACPDTSNTIKVFKGLFKQLPITEYGVFKVENELQEAKAIQEYYGLRSNQQVLLDEIDNLTFVVDTLSNLFKKWHKTSKNINSPDVLRNIVYNELGCKVVVRTKKNKPSTSVDAISLIVNEGVKDNVDFTELPSDILDKKGKVIVKGKDLKANKYPSLVILSAYNTYKKELGAVKRLHKLSIKGRIMFGINGTGAASNRQTSDAHQYSDTMKGFVLSDTPEHTLSSVDYAQIELRVLAYLINDKRLIEQMKDKHIDIHRAFLNVITGIPIHLISAPLRSKGKAVNFGVVYGISKYGLARDRYGAKPTDEQFDECENAITDFYNSIPGCKLLAYKNKEDIFKKGYIETKFGYRRYLYDAFKPDLTKKEQGRVFRMGNNTPVQGFAAHIMKLGENNFTRYIKNKGWDKTITYMDKEFPLVRVMLSIHDEVLISSHDSIPKEEIILMCKECMEIEIPGAPPFFAVPTFIETWAQGKADEFEIPISMRDEILENWKQNKTIVDWGNLTQSIKQYKLNTIKEYMSSMISIYKVKEEIIKNINHPEYTHLLISIYVTKDKVKTHTQEECIALAVEAYLENPDNQQNINISTYDNVEDRGIKNNMNYLNDIEKYIEVTSSGNIVEGEETEDEEDDLRYREDELYDSNINQYYTEIKVLYLGNVVMVDVTNINDKSHLHQVHQEISSLCSEDGYYTITYMRGKSTLNTGMRMHYRKKELEDIITKYIIMEGVNNGVS